MDDKQLTKSEVSFNTDYEFINHPPHYNNHKIITKNGEFFYETIEYLHSVAKRLEDFLNADEIADIVFGLKYADGLRGGKPDGNKTPREKIAEDCQKVAWYFSHAAETIKENEK